MFANYYDPATLTLAPWKLVFQALTFAPATAATRPVTLAEAVRCIKPGDNVYITGNDGQLPVIHHALRNRALEIDGDPVKVLQLLGRDTILTKEELRGKVKCITPFPGSGARKGDLNINNNGVEVIPMHLNKVDELFDKRFRPNVVIVHTSAPKGGKLHLAEGGIAIHALWTCKQNGGKVIAVVNGQYPFLGGHCFVAIEDADYVVHINTPPLTHPHGEPDPNGRAVMENIALLLQDGDVLQMGIGPTENAVLDAIKYRELQDISVFSEVLEVNAKLRALIEAGVINGRGLVGEHYGHLVCGILLVASQEDYVWLRKPENGRRFHVEPQAYVNCRETIQNIARQGHRFVSVNAALQANVLGEVAAHTYAPPLNILAMHTETCLYSNFGGALDFNRGAADAGGISIIVLHASRIVNGDVVSNICAAFPQGTMATYTAADTMYLVTEHAGADLRHLSYQERFSAILRLAAPQHRDDIVRAVRKQIPALADVAVQ